MEKMGRHYRALIKTAYVKKFKKAGRYALLIRGATDILPEEQRFINEEIIKI